MRLVRPLLAMGATLLSTGALLLVLNAATAPQAALADTGAGQTILCGGVSRRPWAKTAQSWDAGGGEYYLMEMDPPYAEQHPEYRGSIILRPSDDGSVTEQHFAQWNARHLCVRGQLLHASAFRPEYAWEQYPVGADGNPSPRGSGIRVSRIGRLADVQK